MAPSGDARGNRQRRIMNTNFAKQPELPNLAAGVDTGELDLEDRHAPRRVSGLSTELQDVSEVEYRALRLERVILVGVWTEGTLADAENSLRELSRLAETAGSVILEGLVQRRGRPDAGAPLRGGQGARGAG